MRILLFAPSIATPRAAVHTVPDARRRGLTAGTYADGMTTEGLPTGPDPVAIREAILTRWPETAVAEAMAAVFFSLDPERHFPNFATIVTPDAHDEGAPSDLARPGVFR